VSEEPGRRGATTIEIDAPTDHPDSSPPLGIAPKSSFGFTRVLWMLLVVLVLGAAGAWLFLAR
jgi:hypothetical protein